MLHLQLFVSCLELVELCGNGQKSYPKQNFSLWLKFQDVPETPQLLCAIQSCQQEIWGLLKFVLFWHGSSSPCGLCIKCHDALGWKVGNIINTGGAVRLWSCCNEKSICGFFSPRISASAESTRQMWEHLTLPLLSLPPRSKLPSLPPSPVGVTTNWWNASLWTTQSGENCKQTNQPTKKTRGSRTHKKQCRNRVVSQLASNPIHQTSNLLDYLL